jgi:hypothetical protein
MAEEWGVYKYEVDMFQATLALVRSESDYLPLVIRNALVESMLLHLRILVGILLSHGWEDDVKLKEILPGFQSANVDKLKELYGDRKQVGSCCSTLDKMLAHASKVRSDQYDYSSLVNKLLPTISALLAEIHAERVKT